MAPKKPVKVSKKPDFGNLLETITTKRESGELPESPIQKVVPESEVQQTLVTEMNEGDEVSLTHEIEAVKEVKQRKIQAKALSPEKGKKTGRPSVKIVDIEYTRLSPRIPVDLKTELDVAIARKSYKDSKGMIIKTIDEFITEAVHRMIEKGK